MILSIDIFYFKTVIIGGPTEKAEIYRNDGTNTENRENTEKLILQRKKWIWSFTLC